MGVIDHLVYAVPDVAAACDELERDWGVRPTPGGRHPGRGTHNALLDLAGGCYLEVIGPDPSQPDPAGPRPFGIDALAGPGLVTWAVPAPGIEDRAVRARAQGFDPGPVTAMSRTRPDGVRLDWKLTGPDGAGTVPFLIDWGGTPHPTADLPEGCRLVRFRAEHPHPELVEPALLALGVELELQAGPRPCLVASVETPRGSRELT
ncbi:MAG: VOC family protein [Acidimicrobiia bacterium]